MGDDTDCMFPPGGNDTGATVGAGRYDGAAVGAMATGLINPDEGSGMEPGAGGMTIGSGM